MGSSIHNCKNQRLHISMDQYILTDFGLNHPEIRREPVTECYSQCDGWIPRTLLHWLTWHASAGCFSTLPPVPGSHHLGYTLHFLICLIMTVHSEAQTPPPHLGNTSFQWKMQSRTRCGTGDAQNSNKGIVTSRLFSLTQPGVVCVCVCVCSQEYVYAKMYVWKSEDSLKCGSWPSSLSEDRHSLVAHCCLHHLALRLPGSRLLPPAFS